VSNSQGNAGRVDRIRRVVAGRRPADAGRLRLGDRDIELAGWTGERFAPARWQRSQTDGLVRARGVIAARCRLGADTHAELLEADARTRAMDVADA